MRPSKSQLIHFNKLFRVRLRPLGRSRGQGRDEGEEQRVVGVPDEDPHPEEHRKDAAELARRPQPEDVEAAGGGSSARRSLLQPELQGSSGLQT